MTLIDLLLILFHVDVLCRGQASVDLKKKKRHIVFGKFHTKIRHLKKKKCSNKTVTDIKAHLAIRLSASKRPLHTNYLQFLQFYHIYIICVLKWRVVKMRKHDFFFLFCFSVFFFFFQNETFSFVASDFQHLALTLWSLF